MLTLSTVMSHKLELALMLENAFLMLPLARAASIVSVVWDWRDAQVHLSLPHVLLLPQETSVVSMYFFLSFFFNFLFFIFSPLSRHHIFRYLFIYCYYRPGQPCGGSNIECYFSGIFGVSSFIFIIISSR